MYDSPRMRMKFPSHAGGSMTEASTITGSAATAAGRSADRRMLIDGRLVETSATFSSLNPATTEVVGHAPDATVEDAESAIAASLRAFDATDWSSDVDLRIRCLDQLHAALIEHRDDLAALNTAEVGA